MVPLKLFLTLILAALVVTSCNKETAYGVAPKDKAVVLNDSFIAPPPPPPPAPVINPYPSNLTGFIKFMNDHAEKRWGVNSDNTTSAVYFGWTCEIAINGTPIHQRGIWYWVPTGGFMPTAFPYIHQNLNDTATAGSNPSRSVSIGTDTQNCSYLYETSGLANITVTAGTKTFRWVNVPWLIQQNRGTEDLPFGGKNPGAIDIVIR